MEAEEGGRENYGEKQINVSHASRNNWSVERIETTGTWLNGNREMERGRRNEMRALQKQASHIWFE